MFIGRKEQLADLMTLWRKRFIDEAIVGEVEEKVRRLPLRKGLSARPVLVYDGELQPSVEGTGYFDAVIDARQLLDL